MHPGDRVMTPDEIRSVPAGSYGTVVSVKRHGLSVDWDCGVRTSITGWWKSKIERLKVVGCIERDDLVYVLVGNEKTREALWRVKRVRRDKVMVRMLPPHSSPDMTREYDLKHIRKLSPLELLARQAE